MAVPWILQNIDRPYVHYGPLLRDFPSGSETHLGAYQQTGGYEVARRVISRHPLEVIQGIEDSRLRGRAGAGFPTGHKWKIVATSSSSEKYFICNANAGQPGGFKERFLLRASPHRIIESMLLALHALSATTAVLLLPKHFGPEADLLEIALREAQAKGLAGEDAFGSGRRLNIVIYQSWGGYISGEETALMEMIEGRSPQPRGKPPLPVSRGLFDAPTVVNNLETLLHVYYIVKHGAACFRGIGPLHSPGSLIFSVSGHVRRPGLYELPLGTTLRELIFEYAQGTVGGPVKMVFPGGVFSSVLADSSLDLPLDYDSAYDAHFNLGSGAVLVANESVSAVHIARRLAAFFQEKSCGKCKPCKDGTQRTMMMLERLEGPGRNGNGTAVSHAPVFNILNNAPRIGYTDTVQGLDKIRHLCEFYKYRGDCHHSTEAADSIQRLLDLFPAEFKKYENNC
jgi:NADH-quinone oxidoreductase subunit F